ncbi:MAG TPA: hypothetical protein VHN14_32410 [Kofleriaceae bacterium]|jgi:hypothetical protein|nr:hypothetical protein [Kofleriaceae bacterium]
MSAPRGQLRRAALALGVSTAIVVMVAWLLPRAFLVNDDPWLTQYLRKGLFTPWISPILVRVLSAAYHDSPEVPWYGLYQYAVVAVSGAIVIHTCMELVDPRPGPGRVATLIGACAVIASEVVIAAGLTWTVVSIFSLGASAAALVAHLHVCQVTGRKASVLRALGYGLLAIGGYMLRPSGLGATVAALLPLFGWLALCLWRARHLPRPAALIAAIAPLAVVIAIQNRIPQLPGAEFDEFNQARGQISGQTAFEGLDTRAPELIERAGWTIDEYRDFITWQFYDDQQFTVAKLRRLIDTGGVPTRITAASAVSVLRTILDESPAATWLFLASVLGAVLLAWLRVIEPGRGLVFGLGYLACEIAVPQWMASQYRFPMRLSLPFYLVAAFGMFVILTREIAARPAAPELPPTRARHASFALLVTAMVLFFWARNVIAWADRPIVAYTPEARAFIARTAARGGFVFPRIFLTDFDPLVVDPHGYSALNGGWSSFTKLWYDYLAQFGLHHFREVLPWMVNNPDAYMMAVLDVRTYLEDWSRRLLDNHAVRLAVVDIVDTPSWGRVALYRLVTQPLVRGTPEWQILERAAWEQGRWLPGPPSVADLAFRPVSFTAPYARYASELRAAGASGSPPPAASSVPASGADITLEPIDGGLRCTTAVDPGAACAVTGEEGDHAGIRAEVHGLRAARFELSLLGAENIVAFHVLAESASQRTQHWRWDLSPEAQQFGFRGAFTVVPDHGAQRLQRVGGSAAPGEIVAVHLYVTIKPGTRAGFEVRHLEVAEP